MPGEILQMFCLNLGMPIGCGGGLSAVDARLQELARVVAPLQEWLPGPSHPRLAF